jgi:hypothetical protein
MHDRFIEQAREFKRALEESTEFTADEIAAMLGSFVLASYNQQFITQYPPEMMEMLTKQNLMVDRVLVEEEEDA